jgi:hypothetical protein
MSSASSTGPQRSLFKEIVGWAPLLIFLAACLIGYRLWAEKMEVSPVATVHQEFLAFMATRSSAAKAYQDSYFNKFGRDSVASKHFEQVCAAMFALAMQDGVDPARHSAPSARACRSFARKYSAGALPE